MTNEEYITRRDELYDNYNETRNNLIILEEEEKRIEEKNKGYQEYRNAIITSGFVGRYQEACEEYLRAQKKWRDYICEISAIE